MLNKIRLPKLPECEFRLTTLLAISAGTGAAAGMDILPWYTLLPLPFLLFFLNKRQIKFCVIAFACCLISGFICRCQEHEAAQQRPLYYKKISGTLYCIDRKVTQVQDLSPLKTNRCMIRYKNSEYEATVMLPPEMRLSYDRVYEFSGQVTPAKPAGVICGNEGIAGEIPPLYGDHPLVVVKDLSESGKRFSIFNWFLDLRDIALKRLICNIQDQDNAEMAARLFFGAGNGASSEQKKNFVESGTIHLFSVSGLHVTLFAGIILLLLYPLPFVWRYRITAILTLLYVLCTGASLPAVRAGAMFIIWAVCRSFLFRITAWDTLMIVWCIFALADPSGVGSVSALYSFGITAALLLLAGRFHDAAEAEKATFNLMPSNHNFTVKRRNKLRWQRKLLMPPASAITAFAAGCGISLYRQTIFAQGSIPANLLLILITPFLFIAMIMKMTVGALGAIPDRCCAFLLEKLFHLLCSMTESVADFFHPLAVPKPPLWSVILFYLLFFGALGLKSHARRICCGIGAAAVMILIWIDLPQAQPTRIITISNSKNVPPLIAIIKPGGNCNIINVPNKNSGKLAGKLLIQHGVRYASVNFSDGTQRTSGGCFALSQAIPFTAYLPAGNRKHPTAAFTKSLDFPEIMYPEIAGNIQIKTEDKYNLFCRTPDGLEITTRNTEYGRYVEIKTPDGKIFSNTIPWYHLPVVWECRLE